MPTSPTGKTGKRRVQDKFRPVGTRLYQRRKMEKCLEHPRWQPPAPKFQQGGLFGDFEVVKTRYGFSWKRKPKT